MDNFDFIIVGAGSAGCVLADRLSADGKKRILLLEAGGSDAKFWIKTPIGYGKTFMDESVNWKYTTEPVPGLAHRTSYWPRGKVVGGSSSINAMVYARGLPTDFDDWRDAGNPGWGWSDVEPVFKSFEHYEKGDGTHEGDGPLWVSNREAEYHPLKRHFIKAATELGLPLPPEGPALGREGVGAYRINTKNGLRCSSADAFLRPALKRPNVELRRNVLVERIVFKDKRAVAVDYRRDGQVVRVAANAEVIVSGGAINSPQLLQLSGIGPGALLQDKGVALVHANDGVGGHLQDHLGVNYYYKATENTLNSVLGSWPGRIVAGLQFLLTRTGALSLSVNQMGGLVKSSPDEKRANIQLYYNPLSYSTEIAGKRVLMRPDPFPGFIMGYNSCRPTSTGRIDIASNNPADPPSIQPNYLSTQQDVDDVLAGSKLILRLQETAAMQAAILSPNVFSLKGASDDAIIADFRARSGSVYHPSCTCRMAPQQEGGVVNPELKVYGVEGLRVVDASAFPNVTSGNTNAPVIMLANKAASLINAG